MHYNLIFTARDRTCTRYGILMINDPDKALRAIIYRYLLSNPDFDLTSAASLTLKGRILATVINSQLKKHYEEDFIVCMSAFLLLNYHSPTSRDKVGRYYQRR